MNTTNRALNRTGILLLGLVLLALGAAVALAALVPGGLAFWRDGAASAESWLADVLVATPLGTSGHSWLLIALAAAGVLAIVLLLVFVFRQGGGSTRTLVRDAGDIGVSTIDVGVAESAIVAALEAYPGIVSTHVSSHRLRRSTVMRIRVNARRGTSPRDIREYVDTVVGRWDALLGRELPVLVTISAGIASRFSATTKATDETVVGNQEKELTVSASDKIKNAAEDLVGKGKEAVGNATDNDKLVAEGKADQAKASVKKTGEDVKDAFK